MNLIGNSAVRYGAKLTSAILSDREILWVFVVP